TKRWSAYWSWTGCRSGASNRSSGSCRACPARRPPTSIPAIWTPSAIASAREPSQKYAYALPAARAVPPTARRAPTATQTRRCMFCALYSPRATERNPQEGRAGLVSRPVRVQFVDCRWELGASERGRELYLAGHIPGAAFLDVDEDLSDLSVRDAGRHPLPSAERFARAASLAGIRPGVLVVAYGTMGGPERLWWLLRHYGHDDCGVLLGGLEAWAGPLRAGEEGVELAEFVARERLDD